MPEVFCSWKSPLLLFLLAIDRQFRTFWRLKHKLLAFTYELDYLCQPTKQNAAGSTGRSVVQESGVKGGARGILVEMFNCIVDTVED